LSGSVLRPSLVWGECIILDVRISDSDRMTPFLSPIPELSSPGAAIIGLGILPQFVSVAMYWF